MAAELIADIGPCDDEAHFYVNGTNVASTILDETRRYKLELPDGDHTFRFRVVNSGAWAWRAKLHLQVNQTTLADIHVADNHGPIAGPPYDAQWRCRIRNGTVTDVW